MTDTTSTTPQLKPCPFCGREAKFSIWAEGTSVSCSSCFAWTFAGTQAGATDKWNTRPTEAALEAENTRLRSELEGSETSKNNAYAERDKLVAALSKMFPSSLERHPETEAWEDDWRWIVFIDLPTGQATWHIHDSELPMFDHLRRISGRRWDGHTTEEKYRRIAALESEKAQLRSKLDAAMAFVPTDAWGPEDEIYDRLVNGVNPTLTTASNPVDTTKYQKDGDK